MPGRSIGIYNKEDCRCSPLVCYFYGLWNLSSSFYSPTFWDAADASRPIRVFSLGEGTLGSYVLKPIKGVIISRDIGSQAGHRIQFAALSEHFFIATFYQSLSRKFWGCGKVGAEPEHGSIAIFCQSGGRQYQATGIGKAFITLEQSSKII